MQRNPMRWKCFWYNSVPRYSFPVFMLYFFSNCFYLLLDFGTGFEWHLGHFFHLIYFFFIFFFTNFAFGLLFIRSCLLHSHRTTWAKLMTADFLGQACLHHKHIVFFFSITFCKKSKESWCLARFYLSGMLSNFRDFHSSAGEINVWRSTKNIAVCFEKWITSSFRMQLWWQWFE